MAAAAPEQRLHLRRRIAAYLRDHHTMTIATAGPIVGVTTGEADDATAGGPGAPAVAVSPGEDHPGNSPHAASVFYAMDDSMRLIFLSKPSSMHGIHIGDHAPVAATITEQYADWEAIQGVQLWGEARLLRGSARLRALAAYTARFPFLADFVKRPGMATLMRSVGVYRVEPLLFAFTDNTTGVFGREVLDMKVK